MDYQVVDTWLYPGNIECQNIYYYRATTGTPSAQDLVEDIIQTELHSLLANIMNTGMVASRTEAFNLVNTQDFYVNASTTVGTIVGDILASFYAVGFRIIRSDRAFRDSGKRYPGITESWVTGNSLAGVASTPLALLQTWLANPQTSPAATYQLMIPKRVPTINPDPPPSITYVLNDLSQPSSVSTAYVTTQNSRKRL